MNSKDGHKLGQKDDFGFDQDRKIVKLPFASFDQNQ